MSNKPVVPAKVMKMLKLDKQLTDRDMIRNYLISEPNTVQLSEKQEALLERWSAADELVRSRRHSRTEMLAILRKKFDYSIATAKRDMADMQYVYGSLEKDNRSYLISLHLDFIQDIMNKLYALGKYADLKGIMDSYTKALKEMPDHTKGNTTPAVLMFNFTTNVTQDLGGAEDEEAAIKTAKSALGDDYTEFEEV